MISFYKDETGVVMYLDDTNLEIEEFAIERPAMQTTSILAQTNMRPP